MKLSFRSGMQLRCIWLMVIALKCAHIAWCKPKTCDASDKFNAWINNFPFDKFINLEIQHFLIKTVSETEVILPQHQFFSLSLYRQMIQMARRRKKCKYSLVTITRETCNNSNISKWNFSSYSNRIILKMIVVRIHFLLSYHFFCVCAHWNRWNFSSYSITAIMAVFRHCYKMESNERSISNRSIGIMMLICQNFHHEYINVELPQKRKSGLFW